MPDHSADPALTRREWLKTGLAAGGAALAAVAAGPVGGLMGRIATASAAGAARPNVIIIYCDDLGYGDLGCYGSRAVATPNADRLAGEGVRLTDYYACNAVCAPSRAGLLTGRYPFRSGIIGNVYPKDEPFRRRLSREYIGGALRELGSIDLREGKSQRRHAERRDPFGRGAENRGLPNLHGGQMAPGRLQQGAVLQSPAKRLRPLPGRAPQQRHAPLPPVSKRGDASGKHRYRPGQAYRTLHRGGAGVHSKIVRQPRFSSTWPIPFPTSPCTPRRTSPENPKPENSVTPLKRSTGVWAGFWKPCGNWALRRTP